MLLSVRGVVMIPLQHGHQYICGSIRAWSSVHMWSITVWSSLHMWVHYGVVITTYVGPLGCGHHYICGSIMVWSSLHMWVH